MSKSKSFALWVTVGSLFTVGFLAILSIGWLLLAVALAVIVTVVRKGSTWPEMLGLPAGAGLATLLIGFAHWQRCASSARAVIYPAGSSNRLDASHAITLTGGGCISSINYQLWMLGGLALLMAGLVAYWITCRWGERKSAARGQGVSR